MTTSVVIPAWNGLNFLKNNLPHVLRLNTDEVIIVDDASTDDSVKFIQSNYPQIKLIKHTINQRFPKTVNDGFNHATGDIVFLLNQDAYPQLNLKHLLSHFESNPNLFAVTFNDQHNSYAQGQLKSGFIEFSNGPITSPTHTSLWASGGASAFRKTFWDKLGGFDPIFTPGYFEDFDLGIRAHKAGYDVIWCQDCIINHDQPSSAFKSAFGASQLSNIQYRNYLLTHWKNLDSNLIPHLIELTKRTFLHPKQFPIVLQALTKLPQIKKVSTPLNDKDLFTKLNPNA